VEFELSSGLLQEDPEAFQRHIRNAYTACAQAVQEELTRHVEPASAGGTRNGNGNGKEGGHGPSTAKTGEVPVRDDGSGPNNGHPNGNAADTTNGQTATERQTRYLRTLAGQIPGLGIRRLDAAAQTAIGKPLAAFTSGDASTLIDLLIQVKAGEMALEALLEGDAS
jgi:hypothetical protein